MPADEIQLKFFEIPPTNDLRKVRPNSERGTNADQQYFIHATDWGECFDPDRGKAIKLCNGLRGHFIVRRYHNAGDTVV